MAPMASLTTGVAALCALLAMGSPISIDAAGGRRGDGHERLSPGFLGLAVKTDPVAGAVTRGSSICEGPPPALMPHLRGPRPQEYDSLMLAACSGVALCAAISLPLLLRLLGTLEEVAVARAGAKASSSSGAGSWLDNGGWWKFLVCVSVPLVVATLKCLAVVVPRTWKLVYIAGAIFETFAFWSFMHLMLGFVGSTEDVIIKRISAAPPNKMWAVPPLACCFRSCVQPRPNRASDVLAIRTLVWQFIIVCPLLTIADELLPLSHHEKLAAKLVETVSLLCAFYGIFALVAMLHDVIPERLPHAKFWTMKGVFIVSNMTLRIAQGKMTEDVSVGSLCYSSEDLAFGNSGALTAAIMPAFALLAWYAYPKEDLLKWSQNLFRRALLEVDEHLATIFPLPGAAPPFAAALAVPWF